MGSYGLPEWIRVSVGTMDQNKAFIAAFRELDREGVVGRDALATVA
jgi:histidinol-phosphate/aromatic aminotransferase/cobyric acid decarboxylase-like protein